MDWSGGESQEQPVQPGALPPFPRIWIGYLLGVATLVTEIIAITLHPELAKEPLLIPPLYLFLTNFISLVYWLVCVYEIHVVLLRASAGAYPIKPLRAAWFHLIPIYGLYWVFKWPRELARFVNGRHDLVVLVRIVFNAMSTARIGRAACVARGSTAIFMIIPSEESKCK
jgi:hypothetical protein